MMPLIKIVNFVGEYGRAIEPFSAGSNPRSRWLTWKRAFEVYIGTKELTDPKKKQNLLLHCGGIEIQEVFYAEDTITFIVTDPEGKVVKDSDGNEVILDEYEATLHVLDLHYAPKLHIVYERHIFRSIHQDRDEPFDSFVLRLRQQLSKCEYCADDADKEAVLQIVEGCKADSVKARLLEKPYTLAQAIQLGRSSEQIKAQSESFKHNGKDEVQIASIQNKQYGSKSHKELSCYRCGRVGHLAKDKHCPAWGKKCNNCGGMNHFAVKCNKTTLKRRHENDSDSYQNQKRYKVNTIREVRENSEEMKFSGIFHFGNGETSEKVSINSRH